MRPVSPREFPEKQLAAYHKARRLEWLSVGYLVSAGILLYLVMGSSQAMRTSWLEDLVSIVPPVAFLVASRVARRPPSKRYPYGMHGAVSIAYLTAALALLAMAGCEYPRDAEGTLERVRGGILRVGVAEHPPWVVMRDDKPEGIEPRLLSAFAAKLGARIEWVRGSEAALVEALKRRRIDVLAAGLRHDTPWKRHGAVSLPYAQTRVVVAAPPGALPPGEMPRKHVMLAAPGESRFLFELDRFLKETGRELALAESTP